MLEPHARLPIKVTAVFNEMDADGSGGLDEVEVIEGFERLGVSLKSAQASRHSDAHKHQRHVGTHLHRQRLQRVVCACVHVHVGETDHC